MADGILTCDGTNLDRDEDEARRTYQEARRKANFHHTSFWAKHFQPREGLRTPIRQKAEIATPKRRADEAR